MTKDLVTCPIENTVKLLNRKWTIVLIRDMFLGKKRFLEFKENKPNLSNNVLYIKELNLACEIDSASHAINSNDFLNLKNINEVKLPTDLYEIIESLNSNERNA